MPRDILAAALLYARASFACMRMACVCVCVCMCMCDCSSFLAAQDIHLIAVGADLRCCQVTMPLWLCVCMCARIFVIIISNGYDCVCAFEC